MSRLNFYFTEKGDHLQYSLFNTLVVYIFVGEMPDIGIKSCKY